jgi:hypothetical protein
MRAWILVSSDATARKGTRGIALALACGCGRKLLDAASSPPCNCSSGGGLAGLLEMRCEKRRTRRAAAFFHPVP